MKKLLSFTVLTLLAVFSSATVINAQVPRASFPEISPNNGGGITVYGDVVVKGDDEQLKKANFMVFIYAGPRVYQQQTVSAGGRYRFLRVPQGDYDIVLEYENKPIYRTTIRIVIYQQKIISDQKHDIYIEAKTANAPGTKSGTISVESLYQRTAKNQSNFDKALSEASKKNFDSAISLLNQIVGEDPKDFVAWTELGTIYFKANKQDDAEKAYQNALAQKSDYFLALLNFGKLYLSKKNFDKAIEVLGKSVEIKPQSADANHFLGEAYLQVKKGSKAVGYLNEAIRLDPIGKAEIHLRLAALYNGAGMIDKAVTEYEQFLSKKPDYPEKEKIQQYITKNKRQ